MSNIGIDASRAFKKEKTGVEWYAYNIIKNLLKIDSRNQYILYSQNSSINFLDPQVPPIRRAGKPENDNMRWKKLKWPFKYFWTQGRLSLEMLLNKPDTLFIPASAMPIIHPKNTVVAIHDVGFMKYPEAYSKWQRIYLKWSTKFAIKHAKSIITISEFSKQEIIKYFTNTSPSPLLGREGSNLEDKIFITPLACDTEKFKVITDQNKIQTILKKYNINSPYILFTGRLETKKNILNIVKAFAEFNTSPDSASLRHPLLIRRGAGGGVSHKLVLAGNEGHSWAEVKNFILENNLENNIIITGYVADEDLPYLYNGADLFLFPSLYEGFGLPVLEAMACGTPVITSSTTSLPEVAGEAAVLVDPNNYKEIATTINKVLNDDMLRSTLRSKGLERVKKFTWEKCAQQTLEIFGS